VRRGHRAQRLHLPLAPSLGGAPQSPEAREAPRATGPALRRDRVSRTYTSNGCEASEHQAR
jgi:hypothetical protein